MLKINHKVLLLLTAALLITSPATAKVPTASPEELGLSSKQLASIDEAIAKFIKAGKIPGAVVMVARRGRIAYVTQGGKARLKSGAAMRRDSIFRIYSMSKPVTSVAALMLVEEGKIRLDQAVDEILPELKELKVLVDGKEVKQKARMTIRDLLRHSAGLTYGFFGSPVDEIYRKRNILDRDASLAEMITKLSTIPLDSHPGEKWNYSIAVDVLGRVIEVISGQSLAEFLEQRLFKPLAMVDTGFHVPAAKQERLIDNTRGGQDQVQALPRGPFLAPPKAFSGGGGLVSTVDDYLRFAMMLANRGEFEGRRYLKAATVDAMTRNQLPKELLPIRFGLFPLPNTGFGLGVSVLMKDRNPGAVGEYGWGGAASTTFIVAPKEDLIVLVFSQVMPMNPALSNEVRAIAYKAIRKDVVKPKSPTPKKSKKRFF